MMVVIDCKDYASRLDLKGVEAFHGLLDDVGAHKGAIVCPSGFTKGAKVRAVDYMIDLYSPIDTDPHKWQVHVELPVVCDFRGAQLAPARVSALHSRLR